MVGQVEVNKEMAGMEGEEMRVVPCEGDLVISGREKKGSVDKHSNGIEKSFGNKTVKSWL